MDKQLLLKRKAFIEDPDIILKVPYVLDRLLEAGVLSKEEIDSIDANTIIQDEVRELVDIVRKKATLPVPCYLMLGLSHYLTYTSSPKATTKTQFTSLATSPRASCWHLQIKCVTRRLQALRATPGILTQSRAAPAGFLFV